MSVLFGHIYKLASPSAENSSRMVLTLSDLIEEEVQVAFIKHSTDDLGVRMKFLEEISKSDDELRVELEILHTLNLNELDLNNPIQVPDNILSQCTKQRVLAETRRHFTTTHIKSQNPDFKPGDRISYAGRVYDQRELENLMDASLEFWLTAGKYCNKFEYEFAKKFEVNHCLLVNSGSSANLLAFMSLTSPNLGDRRIKRGDEVITVAAGFPTTVAPMIQYGAVPVFLDVSLENGTYNIDVSQLNEALSPKTKAVMIAHTMGNPFDLKAVKEFCQENDLWLVEDNCDALGSKYDGIYTGNFGDIATSSFYPPHHMTMGEGGAVYTNSPEIKRIAESMRDWGRDCWCPSGRDNTCRKRFEWQLGNLPKGYDHKYTYSHFGYNLKATDLQAAVGCAQLEKIDSFVKKRKQNHLHLLEGLKGLDNHFILPQATANSDPSWFGFLLTVKPNATFSRNDIVEHLESRKIQTRMLFSGNIIKHPCFDDIRNDSNAYRVCGNLENTDYIMNHTFWFGVYPGLQINMLDHIIESIQDFCQ